VASVLRWAETMEILRDSFQR